MNLSNGRCGLGARGVRLLLVRSQPLRRDARGRELVNEGLFGGREEEERAAAGGVPRRAASTVDIGGNVFGRVGLHHPLHSREVEPPRGDVGRKQHRVLLCAELSVDGQPLHLLLPAVQAEQRDARAQRGESGMHEGHLCGMEPGLSRD